MIFKISKIKKILFIVQLIITNDFCVYKKTVNFVFLIAYRVSVLNVGVFTFFLIADVEYITAIYYTT